MVLPGNPAPELEVDKWKDDEQEELGEGVYVLDFWSYACPDCSSRAEKLSELHEKTPATVIGVHAPQFGFEDEHAEKGIERKDVEQPVAFDHDKQVWSDYGNRSRPRQVIVKDGEVAWKNAGESETLEEALKEILELEEVPEINSRRHSPMLRLGYANSRGINNGNNFHGEKTVEMPQDRKPGRAYISGTWRQEEEYIEAVEDAVMKVNFRAEEADLVAKPEGNQTAELLLDSASLDEKEGEDVQDDVLELDHPDVYSVVESGEKIHSELTLRVEPGVKLYAFSFR